jgi:hypothetical protein
MTLEESVAREIGRLYMTILKLQMDNEALKEKIAELEKDE